EIQVSEAKKFSVQLDFNPSTAKALVLNDAGKPVVPNKTTGKYELTYGTYSVEAKAAGYRVFRSSFTLGDDAPAETVVPVTLVAGTEGMWDGVTKTEPAQIDGVYQIGTGAELAWFASTVNGGTYNAKGVLTADIDLGDFPWTPIGGTAMAKAFKGTFDGQGHAVKGLYINSSTATYQGLFGYTYGTLAAPVTINNVVVEGEVTAKQYAAGIAAYMGAYVSMDRVGNKANVTSAGTYTGGVTGYVSIATAKITNAFNSGDITGTTNVGGVAGSNNATAVIENVYNVGNVHGTTVGSIVGGTTVKTNVKNAYSMAEYGITNGQTTVSFYDFNMGKVAYLLGEAFGQKIGTDKYPVLGGKKVLYDEAEDKYYNKKNTILAAGDYVVTGKVSTDKTVSNPVFAKFLENDGNYKANATLTGDEDELIITTDEGLLNGFTIEGDAIAFDASKTFSVAGDSREFNVATLDGVTAGEFAITADETDATIGKISGCKVLYKGIVIGEVNNIVITPAKAEVAVADFEDIEIDAETGLFQPEDEEDETAYWNSGDFTFSTYTDDWVTDKYYYDFVGTNSKSDKYESLADQYNSAAGGAKSGNNYVVWYSNYYGSEGIYCPDAMKVSGFYVTNTAWVVNAILNGDGMSSESDGTQGKPFGYSGDDKLTLVITGYDENFEETGTVNYVLAESVGNKIYYVKDWRWVDLTSLGDNVINVQFTITSTKASGWGPTTPTYFCMDDFNGVAPEVDAPMAEADVQQTDVVSVKESINNAPAAIYGVNGMQRNAMLRGLNIIKTADGKVIKINK
ncbi:MAG: DUF4465 domain-containing protein, partial [Prevotella sp.]|nr:DUF4465 domain-containing protein [Candidatus Prevotella equi]